MVRPLRRPASVAAALGLLLLLLACGASPPVPTWTPARSSRVARYTASALLLPSSGKVLVAGGETACLRADCSRSLDEIDTTSADLYDPVTGAWSATGPLLQTRTRAQAVLLRAATSSEYCPACGKVLVAGGFSGVAGGLDSAELYDPDPGQWAPTGAMKHQRIFARSVLLDSGQVLVTGGAPDAPLLEATGSAELFDPKTGAWTETGAMHEARADHIAIKLESGKVLVAGGSNDGFFSGLASAEVYNPTDGTWTTTGSPSYSRYDGRAVLLGSGRVLVVCGWTNGAQLGALAELYDPTTRAWSPARRMAHVRTSCSATLLPSGLVLVAGGTNTGDGEELYDPTSDTWQPAGQMAATRFYPLATLLPSGRVLVVGGKSQAPNETTQIPLASAEVFSLEWSIGESNSGRGSIESDGH